MKARSSKNKGNRFETYIMERLRETVDANTHRTTASGGGIDKNDIRIPSLNLEIEAKNAVGQFNVQGDWEQTKAQRTTGNNAVLVIRHPKRPEFQETLVVMNFEDWIVLLQGQQPQREVSFAAVKEDKWKIQRLIEAAKQVIKIYG